MGFVSVAEAVYTPATDMSTLNTSDVFDWVQYVGEPLVVVAALAVGIALAPRFIGQLKNALKR